MGLAKKTDTGIAGSAVGTDAVNGAESGTQAALERLKTAELMNPTKLQTTYKQRDFDKEARGKTRCVQFEAALMSPAIAGMQFNTMEEYLKLVKQAADAGVAYSFQD